MSDRCLATQNSDTMGCHMCDLYWDTNDSNPPECKRDTLLAQGGHKDDTGKVRMELIPPELLFAVADILTFGAEKYSDRNWEAGMKWSRLFGGLMRHLWAWWGGQHKDPETGRSHLWHACACIAFLLAYEQRNTGTDDRPKKD